MTPATKKRLPPALSGYLFFNATEIKNDPLAFYNRVWRQYGDIVYLPILPNYNFFLAAHPDYVEHMLSTHQERYGKPDIIKKPFGLLMGQGLVVSEGDYWLKHRRLMQPVFHQKYIEGFFSVMLSCTESLLQQFGKKPDGEVIDIANAMMPLTLKIAGLTLFSTDISDEESVFGKAFRTGFEFISYKMNNLPTAPMWAPTPRNVRFRQALQTLDDLVFDIINKRRQNPTDNHDLLSLLLAASYEVTGEGMTDKQLRDEVITLLVAGHETVSSALSWTWYILGQHLDISANLQNELQAVLNGSSLTYDKLSQLQYTRRIIDETLRLYPPAFGVPRVALEDDEVKGYFIPKGSIINMSQYIIHRHPEFWDNPEKFDPDHFLPEKVNRRPKLAYFPFGAGQRICIGKSFALMEATIILASIVQRFRLELVPQQQIEIDPTFTLRPKYGVKVKLWRRS
ncbi:cytochrome P450 [Calothrix sp. NIES-4071]|nr:cytochrome P450 [Calothrix sp. NIES-4071]BAZ62174.1 cytochrome P450 [Calothrix sp. NIES-4105]